jgi:hypothetical protein
VLGGEIKAGDRVVIEDNQPDQPTRGGQQPFRLRAF